MRGVATAVAAVVAAAAGVAAHCGPHPENNLLMVNAAAITVAPGFVPGAPTLAAADGGAVVGLGATAMAGAAVSVTPTLIDNDDPVTITINNPSPGIGDWVGAYSPPVDPAGLTGVWPVKYNFANVTNPAGYLATGVATLVFDLVNMRAPVVFYLFSNSTNAPVLIASAAGAVAFRNYNAPLKVRVMPTGTADAATVVWSSYNSTTPTLYWGTVSGGPYPNAVPATTSVLERASLCGAPANTVGWHDLGLIHAANITGLAAMPRTAVYYVVGDAATADLSSQLTYYVPPAAGDHSLPTRLIVFGDLGRGSDDDGQTWNEYGRPAYNTTAMIAAADIAAPRAGGAPDAGVHMVHLFGDVSYAVGALAVWDEFLDMLQPVASAVPFAVGQGNHEADFPGSPSLWQGTDSGGECGVASVSLLPPPIAQWPTGKGDDSRRRLRVDTPPPANTNTPWYSLSVGMVHLVVLSSEHPFAAGTPQYAWLEADLAAVNRSVTPWLVASLHRPMYIDSNYTVGVVADQTVASELRAALEHLFWHHRVNLGIYGHNHAVQRLSAAYGGELVQRSVATNDSDGNLVWLHRNPQATVHMVAGTGGAMFTINNNLVPPPWSERVFFKYGYARLRAQSAHELVWEWVSNLDGAILDRMTIWQDDPHAPWHLPPPAHTGPISGGAAAGIAVAAVAVIAVAALVVHRSQTGRWVWSRAASSDELLAGMPADDTTTSADASHHRGGAYVAVVPTDGTAATYH